MVPFKPFSIAQEVKTQAKAPALMRRREALQPASISAFSFTSVGL